ncbi:TPA: hypothetical protein QCY54_005549 [Bacillus cereus]|nr:hypothetical protein [Bacillus cereus]
MDLEKDLEVLRTRVLRGAIILDCIEDLKLFREMETALKRNHQDFSAASKEDLKGSILYMHAIDSAYSKIISFMEKLFDVNKISKEQFRKKTFKGYKIVQTIKFLEFSIEECKVNIEMFVNTLKEFYSDFIGYLDVQADCYVSISYLLHKAFVKGFESKFPFLETWVDRMCKEMKEEGMIKH